MITIQEVLLIHERSIRDFGGSLGVRDYAMLESAVNRPYTTFNNLELYPKIEDKAASILESIVKNHPFIDGNKRTGYILMRFLLLKNGKDIKASEEEKYNFVINVASGKLNIDEIKNWINVRLIEKI